VECEVWIARGLFWIIIEHTAYSIQHTAYSTQHTAHSTQHTAYSIQHTAYGIQHAYLCLHPELLTKLLNNRGGRGGTCRPHLHPMRERFSMRVCQHGVCMYVCMCMCVCVYICMYVFMYVCMCAPTYA
jgi:hypothetical protein